MVGPKKSLKRQCYIVPKFVFQTFLLFSTVIMVRVQIHSSKKLLHHKSASSFETMPTFSKQEITAFKTVAFMQIGFTLTLSKCNINNFFVANMQSCSNTIKLIKLVCEIFQVCKLLDVSDAVFAADFKNAIGFAISRLIFLQIHFLSSIVKVLTTLPIEKVYQGRTHQISKGGGF